MTKSYPINPFHKHAGALGVARAGICLLLLWVFLLTQSLALAKTPGGYRHDGSVHGGNGTRANTTTALGGQGLTLADLQRMYPGAKLVVVEPWEMEALLAQQVPMQQVPMQQVPMQQGLADDARLPSAIGSPLWLVATNQSQTPDGADAAHDEKLLAQADVEKDAGADSGTQTEAPTEDKKAPDDDGCEDITSETGQTPNIEGKSTIVYCKETPSDTDTTENNNQNKERKEEPNKESADISPDVPPINLSLHLMPRTSSSGDAGDFLLLIFVVLAFYLVVFAIAATGQMIYKVATDENATSFISAEVNSGQFEYTEYSQNGEEQLVDKGQLNGLKLLLGKESRLSSGSGVGIALGLEAGRLDATLGLEQIGTAVELDGVYAIVGPHMFFNFATMDKNEFNPGFFAELLVGTSENKEVGTISVARLGFTANNLLWHGAYLGLTYGAIYISLEAGESLVRKDGNFNEYVGVSFGQRFF